MRLRHRFMASGGETNTVIKHKELCALIRIIIIYIFTWNITSLMPQAVNHLWKVLLVSSFCQSEDDLHEVSVHQSTVCTFCCLQSLTKGGKNNREPKNKNKTVRSKDKFRLCLSSFIAYEPAEGAHTPF